MVRNALFSYPYFNKIFEMHIDASDFQLEIVFRQEKKTIFPYNRKLTGPQKGVR